MKFFAIHLVLFALATSSFAAKCPADAKSSSGLGEVEMRILASVSCDDAVDLATSCFIGDAKKDQIMAQIAGGICMNTMKPDVSDEVNDVYTFLIEECSAKFADDNSREVGCKLRVMQLFSNMYSTLD